MVNCTLSFLVANNVLYFTTDLDIIISATGPSATIVVRMCPQKAICSYATSALICFIAKIIKLTIICIVYCYMLQDQELLDTEVPGMACRPSYLRAAQTSSLRSRARGRGRTRSRRAAGHANVASVATSQTT